MSGMTSQLFWREPWTSTGEATLKSAITALGSEWIELTSQVWNPATSTIGGIRDYQLSFVSPVTAHWSSVLLHLSTLMGAPLASQISQRISGPCLLLLEYDQAAWGYFLYVDGKEHHHFWNIPEYVEEEADSCVADVSFLSGIFQVPAAAFAPYLQHIQAGHSFKAFPDDEFFLSDHWVRTDFLQRLGLPYPNPSSSPNGRRVYLKEPGR